MFELKFGDCYSERNHWSSNRGIFREDVDIVEIEFGFSGPLPSFSSELGKFEQNDQVRRNSFVTISETFDKNTPESDYKLYIQGADYIFKGPIIYS